jgi:hypothetical protein
MWENQKRLEMCIY